MASFFTYVTFFLSVLFVVLLLKGCRNMIGRNRNNDYRARANARIQGNNQSTNENGATSPSAPPHSETREQEIHDRRFKILTTILHKKVVENPLKHKLALPHETLQSDRSLASDDDEEAQDGPLKEDIYVDILASWRSSRRLATDMVDQSETLYSPKTCAICLEIYKVNDTICWSANEACHHAYHLD
eukprot:scaffold4371_cov230-Chaetoceros_neogracile.AAC.3